MVYLSTDLLRRATARSIQREQQPQWDQLQADIDTTLSPPEPEAPATPDEPLFKDFNDFMGRASDTVQSAGQAVQDASQPLFKSLDHFLGYQSEQEQSPYSGALTTLGGTPEAEAVTRPGGAGYTGAPSDIEGYIRYAAQQRGIDPDIAVRVAESEGGLRDPVRQSDYVNPRTGQREESYGPFQLYLGGGLGNRALQQGIDPRNPEHWRQAVDFALDEAAKGGWGPWYGAARVGIGSRQGVENARAIGVSPAAAAPVRESGDTGGQLDANAIVQQWAGKPYDFGGSGGRGAGVAPTDCSGFVAQLTGLPAHTDTAYRALEQRGAVKVNESQATPGDIVFYMGGGTGGAFTHHMGIYAGPGKVLDMSVANGGGVQVRDIGHAGRFEILRDPTDARTPDPPPNAKAPEPIVQTGFAETSGGEKIKGINVRDALKMGGTMAMEVDDGRGANDLDDTSRVAVADQGGMGSATATGRLASDGRDIRGDYSPRAVEPGDYQLDQPPSPLPGPGGAVEPLPPATVPPVTEAPASSGEPDVWQRVTNSLKDAVSSLLGVGGKPDFGQAASDIQARQATLPGTPAAEALEPDVPPLERIGQQIENAGVRPAWEQFWREPTTQNRDTAIGRTLQALPNIQNETLQALVGGDRARFFPNPLGNREVPVLGGLGQALGVEEGARVGLGDIAGTFGSGALAASQWAGIVGAAIDPSLDPAQRLASAAIPLAGPVLRLGVGAVKAAGGALDDAVRGFEQHLGRKLSEPEVMGITREWESGTYLPEPRVTGERRAGGIQAPSAGIVSRAQAKEAPAVTAAAGRAIGSGVGAAYQESRNPESTPESIAAAGVGAVAGSVGRSLLGNRRAAGLVSRAVRQTQEVNPEPTPGGLYVGASRRRTQDVINEALAKGEPISLTDEQEIARLRMDKFPEEIRPDLINAARNADWFHEQRRGVISDEAVQAAAPDQFASIDDVIKRGAAGKAYNPEETVAIRNLLRGQGEIVKGYTQRLMEPLTKADRDQVVAEALAEAQKLTGLFQVVDGARAEAGRTLRQYREFARSLTDNPTEAGLRFIKDRYGSMDKAEEVVAKYIGMVQDGASPVELAGFLRNVKPGWMDRLNIIRYGSMLSATSTHLRNALGNVLNIGLDVGLKPLAVGIDIARAGVTRGERTRYMGEVSEMARGMLEGTSVGLRDMASTFYHGINPNDVSKIDNIRSGFGSGSGVVDAIAEAPLRALSAADAFFSAVSMGAHSRAIAYRKATREGLSGPTRANRVQDIMDNLYQHLDVLDEASQNSRRSLLQEDRAAVSAGMSIRKGMNDLVPHLGDVVVPFVKTPVNIAAQGIEMSPLGFASVIKDARAGKVGEATDTAARALFGTALMYGAGTLAMNGLMTGGYPEDQATRSTLPPGWQPYSVKIGDRYVGYSNLGPFGIPMAAAVIMAEAQKQGKPIASGETVMKLGKYLGDQTFMRGVSDFFKAFSDPAAYGENITENIATQYEPYFIGGGALGRQIERALGMAPKDPHGALEALMASLPYTANRVSDRTDSLGRPQQPGQTGIDAFVNPLQMSRERPDPTLAALRSAGVGVGAPPKSIKGNDGREITLTRDEQQRFQRAMGRELQSRLSELRDPDPTTRQRTAERVMAQARDAARRELLSAKP